MGGYDFMYCHNCDSCYPSEEFAFCNVCEEPFESECCGFICDQCFMDGNVLVEFDGVEYYLPIHDECEKKFYALDHDKQEQIINSFDTDDEDEDNYNDKTEEDEEDKEDEDEDSKDNSPKE